jgi:transglutaminase-like putative cysteine protease
MTKNPRPVGLWLSVWAVLVLAAAARSAVSGTAPEALAVTLFWGAVYGAGLGYARAHDGAPPQALTNGLAIAGLVAFLVILLTGNLVQALMTLLLWLQAARNLTLKGRRDAHFALAIGLALVVFAASEARSGLFVFALAAFGFAAFAALVTCHRLRGIERERRDDGPGSTTAESFPIAHLATLCGAVFLVASAWYLLVPRPDPMQYGIVPVRGGEQYASESWEREARGQSTADKGKPDKGPSEVPAERRPEDEMDIKRSGSGGAVDPNAIVMYVQSERPLYMRRGTFDRFENDRWRRTDTQLRKVLPQEGEFNFPAPERGDAVRYTVQVVSPGLDSVPLSAHLKQLVAPAQVIGVSGDGVVRLPRPLQPGFGYVATSILPGNGPRPIEYDPAPDARPYLQLPADFSPRIAELAQHVTSSAATPLERAVALESHMRSSYAYSFETVFTSQGVTPLDAFLFDTRRGHCEFFASAMAVMLRSVGIPSRVVNGHLAHSFNPVTGFFEVRAFDGHAWVEAQVDGPGWMTFEPTAAYPVPERRPQTGTALFDLKDYTEKLARQEMLQGKWSPKAVIAAVLRQASELWQALILWARIVLAGLAHWLYSNAAALAVAASAGAALVALGYVFRTTLLLSWARFVVSTTPAARVPLAAFRYLERLARTRRLGREIGETADEYIERLVAGNDVRQAELDLLRRAFNAARYGAAPPAQTGEVARAFSIAGAMFK